MDTHLRNPFHLDKTLNSEWGVELGNLIVLRHVGVEVILPVKDCLLVQVAVHSPAYDICLAHSLFVEHRKHSGIAHADRAHMAVGHMGELVLAVAEHFGLGKKLDMYLKSDE